MRDELNRYLAADTDDWNLNEVAMRITDPQDPRLKPGFAGIPSLLKQPNTMWYTEGRVQEIRREYELQLESLKRLLALRTSAMHRVAEENERLRAQHRVN